jgi:hypothetical protein
MKEMVSLSVIESERKITARKNPYFPRQSCVHDFDYGKKIQKNGFHPGVKKLSGKAHRKDRKRESGHRQYGPATLETGVTFQILPLYSDVQRKTQFAMNAMNYAMNV